MVAVAAVTAVVLELELVLLTDDAMMGCWYWDWDWNWYY
jgi:hypothetical protein